MQTSILAKFTANLLKAGQYGLLAETLESLQLSIYEKNSTFLSFVLLLPIFLH